MCVCACAFQGARNLILFSVEVAFGEEVQKCQNDARELDLDLVNEVKLQISRNFNWHRSVSFRFHLQLMGFLLGFEHAYAYYQTKVGR